MNDDADYEIASRVHIRTFGVPVEYVPEGSAVRTVTFLEHVPPELRVNVDYVMNAPWGGAGALAVSAEEQTNIRVEARRRIAADRQNES